MVCQGLLERIQAKLELFRLEKRYTRRRHLRSSFVSNAVYVDGEYIYQTPNTTGSSASSSQPGSVDALHGARPSPATMTDRSRASPSNFTYPTDREQKPPLNRFSSMPGFGSQGQARVVQRQSSTIL